METQKMENQGIESSSIKENKKYLSKIGLVYFLGTLFIIGLQMGISNLFYMVVDEKYYNFGFLVTMLPIYVIAFPIIAFAMSKIPAKVTIEKHKLSFGQMVCFIFISFAGMYIANILGNLLASAIRRIAHLPMTNVFQDVALGNSIWMNFFVMVLCAPIVEEFLFRKFIIDRAVVFGEKFAIVLSAFMFAFFHGNLYQFCYALVIGFVFGYVYVKSGNVLYSAILHVCLNFFGSVLSTLVLDKSGIMQILQDYGDDSVALSQAMMQNIPGLLLYFSFLFCVFAMVITGVVLFFVNLKKISFKSATIEIAKGKKFQTAVFNVGMALFFVFWIGYTVYTFWM